MPVNFQATPAAALYPVPGVRWGIAEAGIRKANRKDLAVLLLDEGTAVGAVFTQNRFCAAPVQICHSHLAAADTQGGIRALLINTGNANAGTGEDGLHRAQATCIALARLLEISPGQVLPFSTGVIMEPLPHERVIAGLPAALNNAQAANWASAAEAIMTTDTVPKAFSSRVTLGNGAVVTMTGIAKGSGMIRPNMATMLGFIATDACIAPGLLPDLARLLADGSFNRITVDGDTSTNDAFVLVATGKAAHPAVVTLDSSDGQILSHALLEIARKLAQAIVRDGEGATKFITVTVEAGKTTAECRQVAYAVAHSPLVKTAFFASDPNLGRILAAVGYAGIADLDTSTIDLYLGDVQVASQGGRAATYQEVDGQRVMQQSEITVRICLGRGMATDTVWTCDLSYEYVKINADYRS